MISIDIIVGHSEYITEAIRYNKKLESIEEGWWLKNGLDSTKKNC
jgi:hypothetical protein